MTELVSIGWKTVKNKVLINQYLQKLSNNSNLKYQ